MSFGGPQWPQEPHQQNDRYDEPYGQRYDPRPGFGGPDTPDWSALAEASAARTRRKRWLLIGGGVLATAAVASIVAVAVVSTNSGSTNASAKNGAAPVLPSDSSRPQPSFSSVAPPPPPNPKDFISSAQKDKAPLSPESLFPGKKLTMGDRVYLKGAISSTTDCASVTQGGLGGVLSKHGCERVIRATYQKDGVAITVGVALFDTEASAVKAKEQAAGGIAPLAGAGVGDFCRATVCLRRANSLGRYAYFTQAGWSSGKKVTTGDELVFKTSDDLGTFTFNQVYARGRAQASAAATAPAGGQ
ncbi:hypothetical protein [Streptomyces sp. SP18CS02]|uniref:hypothetical protein n=1 Tax=Streptomyces sp. SP18CS02 TaxID=3002531 RepID=UPI002E75C7FF|nr:hypothetical protein [Streptomyces sp. SP18CS02]MEE1756027.1 hypothetical protein [Streptomyces sp. SP18CS02]